VITHVYPEGAVAADKRLKIFDHICDVNGNPTHVGSMTTLKVHQLFHTTYEKTVNLTVYRADPPELEKFNVDIMKKPGKELGLSLSPNELGCTIADVVRIKHGLAVEGTSLIIISLNRYKDSTRRSTTNCSAAIL